MRCVNTLAEVVIVIACWIFVIIVLPIFVINLIFLILFKWFVNVLARHRHPDWVPLSALDLACSVFLNPIETEEECNNIGFTLVLDNEISLEEARQGFSNCILNAQNQSENQNGEFLFDRMRKRPVKFLGNYFWSPLVQDMDSSKLFWERMRVVQTDLTDFLNNWIQLGYEKNGPLWEFVLYKDEDEYKGKSVILFKMSHALGDGITIQKIGHAISLPKPTAHAYGCLGNPIEKPLVKLNLATFVLSPKVVFQQLLSFACHSDVISRSEKSKEILMTFCTVEVEAIRHLARQYQCKFNDVLLSLSGNVMRRYLLETGVVERKLPNFVPFISPSAVAGRRKPMENRLTLAIFEVEIRNGSRQDKLRKLADYSNNQFRLGVHYLMWKAIGLIYFLPILFDISKLKVKPGVCCTLTSLPLTDFLTNGQLIFGKYTASHVYALQGLFMKECAFTTLCVTRHDGMIDITLIGNKAVVKSQNTMNKFKEYMTDELHQMIK